MEQLHQVILLAIAVSLIAMEVDLGLSATIDELLYVFRRPGLLLRAFLAVNVIVPAAAVMMVSLFPLTPAARGGILVMAVSSVPPIAPERALKAGGSKSRAYGLYAAIVLLSVVVVPTSVALMSRLYGVSVRLGPLPVLMEVLQRVILPVAAGLLIRRLAPRFAERVAPLLGLAATILLMISVAPLLVSIWPGIMSLIGNGTILAMALVAAIALAAGHLLGRTGPTGGASLALMAATRHPGIALVITGAAGLEAAAQRHVNAAVVAVLLVGTLVAIPYEIWMRRRREPHAPESVPA